MQAANVHVSSPFSQSFAKQESNYRPALTSDFSVAENEIDKYLQLSYLQRTLLEVNNASKIADDIIDLYIRHDSHNDELFSRVGHMCQCAQIAKINGYDSEVILAAFLHDINYLRNTAGTEHTAELGVIDHGKTGAAYLSAKGFSDKVTKLVASSVPTERYLAYIYPEYYDQLPEANKTILASLGGIMKKEEAQYFEKEKFFNLYLLFHNWNEHSSQANVPSPDLHFYKELIIEHLSF